jgi:GR25 family glycosyltransferase involved in LPS biosynthesis
MNEIVDKIYIINTAKATDRMNKVSSEMSRHNIIFERIESVPIDKVTKNTIGETDSWNNRSASLLETTISIIENAKQNNYKKILIFEDDTFIRDNFYDSSISNLKSLLDSGDEWHFIHLNYSNLAKTTFTKHTNILRLLSGCLCCQAYLINETVYDIYLKYLNEIDLPIDHITRGIHRMYKKSFIITTPTVYHKTGEYSTIRERDVDY